MLSAFATYFTLGILQPYSVCIRYFAFSLQQGVASILGLGFNVIFLKWSVPKDESQVKLQEMCEKVSPPHRLTKLCGM